MPDNNVEQRRGYASRETSVDLDAQSSSEVDYREEGLRELVDGALDAVRSDELRVSEEVRSRMPDIGGLDQQTVDAVFSERGFGKRIKEAQEKIASLIKSIRERIVSFGSEKVQAPSQNSNEVQPVLETDLSKFPHAMNLDEYIAKLKASGKESIKDKTRLMQLKMRRIENPERVLGFIKYLEERAEGYERSYVTVKESELKKEEENYKSRGYFVNRLSSQRTRKGKTEISVSRNVPFRFEIGDARKISALLESKSDPVEFFERLHDLGYGLNGLELTSYTENLQKFMDNPDILSLVKKLQAVKGKIGLPKNYYLFDGCGEGERLVEVATTEAKDNRLNTETIEKLSEISEILGCKIAFGNLDRLILLVKNPNIVSLMRIVVKLSPKGYDAWKQEYLFQNLEKFQEAGITDDVLMLYKKGISPQNFLLDKFDYHLSTDEIERVTVEIRKLMADPEFPKFQEFLKEISLVIGFVPNINSSEFENLKKLFAARTDALEILKTAKIFVSGLGEWNPKNIGHLLGNPTVMEIISAPDFQDYFAAMSRAGYKFSRTDLSHRSDFFASYRSENFRKKIVEEENIALAKHLKIFEDQQTSGSRSFEDLMDCPNALESIKKLEEQYGYQYNSNESGYLVGIFQNLELVQQLFSPETIGVFELLTEMGYEFKIAHSEKLVRIAKDESVKKRISNPLFIDFVKKNFLGYSLDSICVLSEIDEENFPILEKLSENFSGLFHRVSSRNNHSLKIFRENPQIIETALKFKEFGIYLQIPDQATRLKDVCDRQLDVVIEKYRAFPSTAKFIYENAHLLSPESWNESFPSIIETLSQEGFSTTPKLHDLERLRDNPKVLGLAVLIKRANGFLSPIDSFGKLELMIQKNLDTVITKYQSSEKIVNLIIKHTENITASEKPDLRYCLREIMENAGDKTIRGKQLVIGEIMGILLAEQEYGVLAEVAGENKENSVEAKRIVEKLQAFQEKYNISGKGHTIETLLAMREYREGEDLSQLLIRIEKSLDRYQDLLERYSPVKIPKGLRASIGMEYEITKSTAESYAELTNGHNLRTDMQEVSNFANVGSGRDAEFEIATKPTDNPHLMLLEMQLLQDLEFIDFNFRKPGYEKGARGYHVTVGGEHGVEVSGNSNFLQNTLVMSGWGGINAGKEVDVLTSARSSNIRQRSVYDSKKVFENTTQAVEFRSLSLDSWEPFERAVETSYFGAIAVQALEKYVGKLDSKNLASLEAKTPEELYDLLQQQGLITETTNDPKVKNIIFEWIRLQQNVLRDVADHDENFLQNEMYGYEDERGGWVDPEEFGGKANRDRFLDITGSERALHDFAGQVQFGTDEMFLPATPNMANKCTRISNIFFKPSLKSGGDVVNATSSLDTTKIGKTIETGDPQARFKSFFDNNGKTREGYYYTQGGSERLLPHRIQMRLLEFNKLMKNILQ